WDANSDVDRDQRITVRDRAIVSRADGNTIALPSAIGLQSGASANSADSAAASPAANLSISALDEALAAQPDPTARRLARPVNSRTIAERLRKPVIVQLPTPLPQQSRALVGDYSNATQRAVPDEPLAKYFEEFEPFIDRALDLAFLWH